MKEKLRTYKIGDATGRLVPEPHGRRTYGYGHRGWEFGYTLYVYKGDLSKGYEFAVSLHPRVYIAFVKGIVKAVAETPKPGRRVSGYYYWLKDKTWEHPGGGEYSILKSVERM
jgi:hypothetical protein